MSLLCICLLPIVSMSDIYNRKNELKWDNLSRNMGQLKKRVIVVLLDSLAAIERPLANEKEFKDLSYEFIR